MFVFQRGARLHQLADCRFFSFSLLQRFFVCVSLFIITAPHTDCVVCDDHWRGERVAAARADAGADACEQCCVRHDTAPHTPQQIAQPLEQQQQERQQQQEEQEQQWRWECRGEAAQCTPRCGVSAAPRTRLVRGRRCARPQVLRPPHTSRLSVGISC